MSFCCVRQVLALQYQGQLDQAGIVAVLRRAAQLAANTDAPTQAEQYACARLLETVAMTCANAIPSMTPATVAAILSTLGALATSGIIVLRQVRSGTVLRWHLCCPVTASRSNKANKAKHSSTLVAVLLPYRWCCEPWYGLLNIPLFPTAQVPYMVVVLVQALILASLPQLHLYSGQQLAYVLRGCALLSPSGLPEVSIIGAPLLLSLRLEPLCRVTPDCSLDCGPPLATAPLQFTAYQPRLVFASLAGVAG